MQVLGMTFGQQQMVLTRLYGYIIAAAPQVSHWACVWLLQHMQHVAMQHRASVEAGVHVSSYKSHTLQ